MNPNLSHLDRISKEMQEPIQQYADHIRMLGGSNVLALTLFGTIVSGTFNKRRHVVRNVMVLDRVELEMLRQLSQRGAKLGKARIAAPLVMTPAYIKASLDTFPLELLEIQQLHLTVLGQGYFDELAFNDDDIRLQCERELKSILIGMRQGLLASVGREKFIGAMDVDVAERFIRTMRGILWRKGQKEGRAYPQVISEVEGLLQKQLRGVRESIAPSGQHGWKEFQALYHDVEEVSRFVESN